MSYRDDIEALYTRATVLQRELEAAKQKLAERDAELARARGGSFAREDTSPGMRSLRGLPDPDDALSRLIDTSARERPGKASLAPLAMPDWSHITTQPPPVPASVIVERVRDLVASLDLESLLAVGAVIEHLADPKVGERERARLRTNLQALIAP